MASKNLTLRIYGPDRKLWASGPIQLRVSQIDSYGEKRLWLNRPDEPRRSVLDLKGNQIKLNLDLQFNAGQRYAFWLKAPQHRTVFQLINRGSFLEMVNGEKREVESATVKLMLVPHDAHSSDLDSAFARLEKRGSTLVAGGAGLDLGTFQSLDGGQKMALLNIEAKLRATNVGQLNLAENVMGFRHVAPDRLFVMMRPEIRDEIESQGDFASAPGHGRPSSAKWLPEHPRSWKHQVYPVGNIQLSFSEKTQRWPENGGQKGYSVDADIDLERGFKHILEWLENNVLKPGQKTDQTIVYSLLFGQEIVPDYTLDAV